MEANTTLHFFFSHMKIDCSFFFLVLVFSWNGAAAQHQHAEVQPQQLL